MAQQFNAQSFKTKTSVLLFGKNWAAPLVLYFDNPQQEYAKIQEIIKNATTSKLIELEAIGPVKKVSLLSGQIAGVALQDEQHFA